MRSFNSLQLLVMHRRIAKDSRANLLHFLCAPKGTMLDFGRENQLKYKDVGTLVSRPEEEVKEVTLFWIEVGGKDALFGATLGA